MNEKRWMDAMTHIDNDLLDRYMKAEDKLVRTRKPWIKWVALAACLCLILGAVHFSQTPFSADYSPPYSSVPNPYISDPSVPNPSVPNPSVPNPSVPIPPVPDYQDAIYSAYEIADLFAGKLSWGPTNAYTKVYAPNGKYLYLNDIPDSEYLPIYRYDGGAGTEPHRAEFEDFLDRVLPGFSEALGITLPNYEIEERRAYSYQVSIPISNYHRFYSLHIETKTAFNLENDSYQSYDPLITLNGHAIQADQRQTDEEIISSLAGVQAQLFDIFGVNFPDVKITRKYNFFDEYGVDFLDVYFYAQDAHPLNAYTETPLSDYIHIRFDNTINYEGDFASDSLLTKANITYCHYRTDPDTRYLQSASARMISLSEAEALLYNGYVFGGHSCPLCMANQEEISFEGYDHVGFEYIFGTDIEGKTTDIVPFYTFYKRIGTGENGNAIYAKTYVPAIEVSGLEAYFQEQQDAHNS